MKTAQRRLGAGRNQKKPDREVTYDKNESIKVVGDFYRDFTKLKAIIRDVPNITTEKIKTLNGMEREKTHQELV